MPTLYSTPPTFMGMLLECSSFIEKCRNDQSSSKEDVLDSMERRISLLIGKMASYPTCTSFRVMLDPSTYETVAD